MKKKIFEIFSGFLIALLTFIVPMQASAVESDSWEKPLGSSPQYIRPSGGIDRIGSDTYCDRDNANCFTPEDASSAVSGSGSSTPLNIPRFPSTETGSSVIEDSGKYFDDTGTGTSAIWSAFKILTELATKITGGETTGSGNVATWADTVGGTLQNSFLTLIGRDASGIETLKLETGASAPSHEEGKMFYDETTHALSYFNEASAVTVNVGQEMLIRAKASEAISDGEVVYLLQDTDGTKSFAKAQADSGAMATSTIAVATHDIAEDDYGYATIIGAVRGIDTSLFATGATLWLSASTGGAVTDTMPTSPNYSIRIGKVGVSDATVGQIEVNIGIGNNTGDVIKIFNGAILEDHTTNVSSDGATVSLTLEKNGGGDLSLFFDGAFTFFESTPAASVNLTAGSDESPTLNYVFIPKSTNTLTANTTGFPTDEQFVPVAEVLVQSATGVQTDGVFEWHAWTDHLSNAVDQGHLFDVNKWIRSQNATWQSGVAPTTTVVTNGGSKDNVFFSNTAGDVLQLHDHTFPATDSQAGSGIFVTNDPSTSYRKVSDLGVLTVDSASGSLTTNNTYYSVVIWGAVAEEAEASKIYANLPACSYINETDALNDVNRCSNYSIPADFKGVGFLIARMTLRYQTIDSGTFSDVQTEDLRGLFPTTTPGGGTTTTGATFSDNVFSIVNVSDDTKIAKFDASGITTGNTRTVSFPDRDLDLADPQFDSVGIGGVATAPLDVYLDQEAGRCFGSGSTTQGLWHYRSTQGANNFVTFSEDNVNDQGGFGFQAGSTAFEIFVNGTAASGTRVALFSHVNPQIFLNGVQTPQLTATGVTADNFFGLPEATESQSGVTILATSDETSSGTEATKSVTPDGLAGSYYGKKTASVDLSAWETDVESGTGAGIAIPSYMHGWDLTFAESSAQTSGTGTATINIKRCRAGTCEDMLSTPITLTNENHASDGVIDGTKDDLQTGDVLFPYVSQSGDAAQGVSTAFTFNAP